MSGGSPDAASMIFAAACPGVVTFEDSDPDARAITYAAATANDFY